MQNNRRKFISAAVAGGLVVAMPFALKADSSKPVSEALDERYKKLDEILLQTFLKKELQILNLE